MMTSLVTLTAADDPNSSGSDDAADDGTVRYDVENGTGMQDCEEGQNCQTCDVPSHTPCDSGTQDVFNAMGINCDGEDQLMATTSGAAGAMGTLTTFGTSGEWIPTEGNTMAVIGSGLVTDLFIESDASDLLDFPGPHADPLHCNDDVGAFDPGATLPAPILVNNVGGDCVMDPTLLGTGDCSNSIWGQFSQGNIANDYTELRLVADVPMGVNSISYDFAFFSTEYPYYFGDIFNDLYIGWLESESWTGNISFDQSGNPISLNAGFLDFRDDSGTLPQFAGTCMKYHAGTKWLSTTAPVTPGERITVVFAVMDLADSILDSYVLLDNWQWGCDGTEQPETTPVG